MSNEQLSSVYRYTDPTLQNNLRLAVSLLRLDVIWSFLKIWQKWTHIENCLIYYLCSKLLVISRTKDDFWLCIPNKQLLHLKRSQQELTNVFRALLPYYLKVSKFPLSTTFYPSHSLLSTKLALHLQKSHQPPGFPGSHYCLVSSIFLLCLNSTDTKCYWH